MQIANVVTNHFHTRQELRSGWIDILRAIPMILVVIGHSTRTFDIFFYITGPIKMPLFFIISGFLFNSKKKTSVFFKNTLRRLVIPWLLLTILPQFLILLINHNTSSLCDSIVKIITGESYWFMPCFIISEILYYGINRITTKDPVLIFLTTILGILGYNLIKLKLFDIFTINIAFFVLPFFTIGKLIKKYQNTILETSNIKSLASICVFCLLLYISYLFYDLESVDIHRGYFYDPLLCILLIIVGCTMLFRLCKKINNSVILEFIGRNTLVIYLLHGYFLSATKFVLNSLLGKEQLINGLLSSFCAIFICCTIAKLINNYCPFIIGKQKKS